MKFIMIVLITSCDPNRALSNPGIAPQIAPAAMAARKHSGTSTSRRQDCAKTIPDPRRRKRRHVQLTFCADVEQPGAKCHRHRQSREDQRRRQEQRVADAVGPPQGAADQQPVGLDRVIADRQHEQPPTTNAASTAIDGKRALASQLHDVASRHQQPDLGRCRRLRDRLRRRSARCASPAGDRTATSPLRARPTPAARRSRASRSATSWR